MIPACAGTSLESRAKRLKALEAKMAQDGVVLTEAQLAALEKHVKDEVDVGQIETEHPGYLGSQDTYYVGTIKGIGRIYQRHVPWGRRSSTPIHEWLM